MNVNKRIILSLIFISALFLALITYLVHFNIFRADDVFAHSFNRRTWYDEARIQRGSIYDRNGILLARSEVDANGNSVRRYPHGRLYSGVIGYSSPVYGRTQLELRFDRQLMGRAGISLAPRGFDLTLTIDNDLQQLARNQLGNRHGAVVAIEPSTGRILALASNPDFDPHHASLVENWNALVENENSPLLPRATQGLYAPGSVYKIVTAAAAFEAGMADRIFNDTGAFNLGTGNIVRNFNNVAHGNIDLARAFAVSSNYVFCAIGYELGPRRIADMAGRFGVGTALDFDIPTSTSRFTDRNMTNADSALISIGQGTLLTTPLHMAMIAAAVANDGVMMQPYLVERSTNDMGLTMYSARQRTHSRPINASTAAYLSEIMELVVTDGTGTAARISGVRVAGKTGTSENEQTIGGANRAHTWFVGFAPADNPQIAVAVLLEHSGGTGGALAAPIAREVMRHYLNR
ncbi:MAG: penicillin-binding transpeptidase domain-containing protein [Oscillospiraceae bacterium]|nr:penicillin-binding transpeptidase domain-containing protein [Oscillospiraceae bacterium]